MTFLMFTLKPDVSTLGLHPRWADVARMYACIRRVAGISERAVLTSAIRPATDEPSFHPVGEAIDLRCKDIPTEKRVSIYQSLSYALQSISPCYEVVWEARDTPNEHIHVEFDDPNGTRPVAREKE